MTEPAAPEESRVEAAARLAAEAAVAALLPRLEALEQKSSPAPAPAVPAGLVSKVDAIGDAVQLLMQPAPAPPAELSEEDRRTLDDLRQAQAETARNVKIILEKETP